MEKVGEEEDDGATVKHVIEKGKRAGNVCSAMLRFKKQHFTDQTQDVPASFAGRKKELDLVGEEQ